MTDISESDNLIFLEGVARGAPEKPWTSDTVLSLIGTIRTLRAELEAERAKHAWRPIATIPLGNGKPLNRSFYLWNGFEKGVGSFDRWSENCWMWDEGTSIEPTPTHWKPLPAAPTSTGESDAD